MADPIETVGINVITFDGVSEVRVIESLARFDLHYRHNGDCETVARLAIPVSELPEVIQALVIGLTNAAKTIIRPVLSS